MTVNVLVLEDQPAWNALLASAIQNRHLPACQIHAALGYAEALQIIEKVPIHAALLDYTLQHGGPAGAKTGLDVARALRGRCPEATILLVTMRDPARVQARCAELGVILIEKGRGDLENEILRELSDGLAEQGPDRGQ